MSLWRPWRRVRPDRLHRFRILRLTTPKEKRKRCVLTHQSYEGRIEKKEKLQLQQKEKRENNHMGIRPHRSVSQSCFLCYKKKPFQTPRSLRTWDSVCFRTAPSAASRCARAASTFLRTSGDIFYNTRVRKHRRGEELPKKERLSVTVTKPVTRKKQCVTCFVGVQKKLLQAPTPCEKREDVCKANERHEWNKRTQK